MHSIKREMMLIGLPFDDARRAEIAQAVSMFGCSIVSMRDDYCIIQAVGSKREVETILNYLKPLGVKDICRTGAIALENQ